MKYLLLDVGSLSSRDALHDFFARELSLPSWYGRNLDALHDCLTSITEDTVLSVIRMEDALPEMEQYCRLLLRMLTDSAEENPHIHLNIL